MYPPPHHNPLLADFGLARWFGSTSVQLDSAASLSSSAGRPPVRRLDSAGNLELPPVGPPVPLHRARTVCGTDLCVCEAGKVCLKHLRGLCASVGPSMAAVWVTCSFKGFVDTRGSAHFVSSPSASFRSQVWPFLCMWRLRFVQVSSTRGGHRGLHVHRRRVQLGCHVRVAPGNPPCVPATVLIVAASLGRDDAILSLHHDKGLSSPLLGPSACYHTLYVIPSYK